MRSYHLLATNVTLHVVCHSEGASLLKRRKLVVRDHADGHDVDCTRLRRSLF